jgi:hypothetical protein
MDPATPTVPFVGRVVILVVLVVIGIVFVGWPDRVQQYALGVLASNEGMPPLLRRLEFRSWTESKAFVRFFRIFGVVMLIAAVALGYVIFWGRS